MPIVATVGAIRLAKPTSVWARHRYGTAKGAAKLARSRQRFDAAYLRRRDRLRDALGGFQRN